MDDIQTLSNELDRLVTLELRRKSAGQKGATARGGVCRRPGQPGPPRPFPGTRLPKIVRPKPPLSQWRPEKRPGSPNFEPRFGVDRPTGDDQSSSPAPPTPPTDQGGTQLSGTAPSDLPATQPPQTPWMPTAQSRFVIDGFSSGDYRLRPQQLGTVRQAVREFQFAAANGTVVISLLGHASAEGPEDMNRVLSFLRAAEVKWVFAEIAEKLGIKSVNYQIRGAGETQPVAAGVSDEARRRNRRVEVAVSATGSRS